MAKDFYKKFQNAKSNFHNIRKKVIVRVWGLAARLDLRNKKYRIKNKKKH